MGRWGPTNCADGGGVRDRLYVLFRASDQTAEMLFVRTVAGRVLWIGTMPAPHVGFKRKIGVATRAGVLL